MSCWIWSPLWNHPFQCNLTWVNLSWFFSHSKWESLPNSPHPRSFGISCQAWEEDSWRAWSVWVAKKETEGELNNLPQPTSLAALGEMQDGKILKKQPEIFFKWVLISCMSQGWKLLGKECWYRGKIVVSRNSDVSCLGLSILKSSKHESKKQSKKELGHW